MLGGVSLTIRNAARKSDTAPLRPVPDHDNSVALSLILDGLKQVTKTMSIAIESLQNSRVAPTVNQGIDFYEEVSRFEVTLIESALRCVNGSQIDAARLLKLNYTTLNSKIKTYGIRWKDFA